MCSIATYLEKLWKQVLPGEKRIILLPRGVFVSDANFIWGAYTPPSVHVGTVAESLCASLLEILEFEYDFVPLEIFNSFVSADQTAEFPQPDLSGMYMGPIFPQNIPVGRGMDHFMFPGGTGFGQGGRALEGNSLFAHALPPFDDLFLVGDMSLSEGSLAPTTELLSESIMRQYVPILPMSSSTPNRVLLPSRIDWNANEQSSELPDTKRDSVNTW
jgi:hypothetical protein